MRPRFLLFGDSITDMSFLPGGWGAALANHYSRKADVVLRGYSGYNTRWALSLLNKMLPPESEDAPALVTIFFGANDAALPDRMHRRLYVPLSEYKDNILKIVSHVQSLSNNTLIVLITPPPVCEKMLQVTACERFGAKPEDACPRTNDATGLYAKACVEVAKIAGVPVIELWSCMQEKSGWQTSYLSDGLHLSPDGNALVFEKLLKVLGDEGLSFEAMEWDFPVHDELVLMLRESHAGSSGEEV